MNIEQANNLNSQETPKNNEGIENTDINKTPEIEGTESIAIKTESEEEKDEKIKQIKEDLVKLTEGEGTKEQQKKEYIALAEKLSHNLEGLPFPGIDGESYSKLKEADEYAIEGYPGYTTPIDENIERMMKEGFKVTLGDHPEQGDVYIMPLTSTDIEKDSLFPRHLKIVDGMDESLKALILANKKISGK